MPSSRANAEGHIDSEYINVRLSDHFVCKHVKRVSCGLCTQLSTQSINPTMRRSGHQGGPPFLGYSTVISILTTMTCLEASISIFGDGSTMTIGAILDSDAPTIVNEVVVEQGYVETNKKLN